MALPVDPEYNPRTGSGDPAGHPSTPGSGSGGGTARGSYIPTATQGQPVPIVIGTYRVAPRIGYLRTKDDGGKTLRCHIVDQYGKEYDSDCAVAALLLCETSTTHPIRGINVSFPFRSQDRLLLSSSTGYGSTYTVVTGPSGGAWASLTGPNAGITFANTAHIRFEQLATPDGKVPDGSVEVYGAVIRDDEWEVGKKDATPYGAIVYLAGLMGIPSTSVQTAIGQDGTADSSFARYCDAMGFRVSGAITDRIECADAIAQIAEACNSIAFVSEGKLKVIPMADAAVTGNGVTFTPYTTPVLIDEDELLLIGDDDPVEIEDTPEDEIFNAYPITISSRASDYQSATYEYIDSAHADQIPPGGTLPRGVRRAGAKSNPWIVTPQHAYKLSSLACSYALTHRRKYRFRISASRWAALEPFDPIALTESKIGISEAPARIVSLEKGEDDTLDVVAVEWPNGMSRAVDLTPQTHDGYDKAPGGTSIAEVETDLADIASDNVLSPGEKPIVIRDYNVIIAEYQALHDQAISFGFTPGTYTGDGTDGGGEAGVLDAEMDIELGG